MCRYHIVTHTVVAYCCRADCTLPFIIVHSLKTSLRKLKASECMLPINNIGGHIQMYEKALLVTVPDFHTNSNSNHDFTTVFASVYVRLHITTFCLCHHGNKSPSQTKANCKSTGAHHSSALCKHAHLMAAI